MHNVKKCQREVWAEQRPANGIVQYLSGEEQASVAALSMSGGSDVPLGAGASTVRYED